LDLPKQKEIKMRSDSGLRWLNDLEITMQKPRDLHSEKPMLTEIMISTRLRLG